MNPRNVAPKPPLLDYTLKRSKAEMRIKVCLSPVARLTHNMVAGQDFQSCMLPLAMYFHCLSKFLPPDLHTVLQLTPILSQGPD